MKWEKKGLVWGPDGSSSWARHSALQPTAISLNDDVIRVYAGFRDDQGIGRVGYVDVDAANPARVLNVSDAPVLDIGRPGTFDENGVVPTAVVRRDEGLYLYYAGYQLGHRVRFVAFGGLAVADANGTHFERMHEVPITDRTDKELYFRVIHCIWHDEGRWKAWYGGGSEYVPHNGKTLPVYDIRYMESNDGVTFPATGEIAIGLEDPDEHRVGRPCVIKTDGLYRMFYAAATKADSFSLGYAESHNGRNWTRKDDAVGITRSADGWDSQMMSYPNVIQHGERVYLFYNGNDYGRAGFGYAMLQEW